MAHTTCQQASVCSPIKWAYLEHLGWFSLPGRVSQEKGGGKEQPFPPTEPCHGLSPEG